MIGRCAMKHDNPNLHRECLMEYKGNKIPEYISELDCEIESAAFQDGAPESAAESTYFFYYDGVEIGCICTLEEKNIISIFNVFIEPKYRGRGFSREMLYCVLEDLLPLGKKIRLHAADNNEPAFSLYAKCGFEVIDFVYSDE